MTHPLSKAGFRLRTRLAEWGIELTPAQLRESLDEAVMPIHGHCRVCGKTRELRYGVCFDCAMPKEGGS